MAREDPSDRPLRIDDVQNHLEAIYGLSSEARAEDFLVDAAHAQDLGATGRAPEELLVCEQEGEVELGLYFAPELLERLGQMSLASVGDELDGALESYCQVAEGVSHFLYLTQTAEQERTVSLLELEAQAEIDKFATCLLHRWNERGGRWAAELHRRLFDQVSYRPTLSAPERWRYEEANRLARRYCQRLIPLYLQRRLDRLLSTLRYSYRLGAEAKLQHLAQ